MTETNLKLEDWLDDLCVRFIINLPQEELESVERIGFAVEEAQWFYEDFVRPLDPTLPSLNLRNFCLRIFQHCPLLSSFDQYHHLTAFSEFLAYKTRVPVRGVILLNDAMDEVLLVKGWKKNASWSFPRGKINKDEKDLDCAVREVYEETGFDAEQAGLTKDESEIKYIEVTMRDQNIRLYVLRGVAQDTYFEPRTRKEISKISWHKLSDLPTFKKMKQQQQGQATDELATNANKYYMVAPFLVPLKKWIAKQKQVTPSRSEYAQHLAPPVHSEDALTEEEPLAGQIHDYDAANEPRGQARGVADQAQSTQEASTLLKQLLKIGGAQSAQQNSTSGERSTEDPNKEKSDALLSLLRKSRNGALPLPASFPIQNPPQTPMDHSTALQGEPGSPHHHHQHHDPTRLARMAPPPQFPIPPSHSTQPQVQQPFPVPPQNSRPNHENLLNHFYHRHTTHPHAFPNQSQRFAPSLPSNNLAPQAPALQSERRSPANSKEVYLSPPQPPQSGALASNEQAAITVPPPKLTSHALNLLNAFKKATHSDSTEVSAEVSGPDSSELKSDDAQAAPICNTSAAQALPGLQVSHQAFRAEPFSTLEASGPRAYSNTVSSPRENKMLSPTAETMPRKTPQPSQHQNNLLSLFRQVSAPTVPQADGTNVPVAGPRSPVELAAQLVPGPIQHKSPPRAILQRPPGDRPKSKASRETAPQPQQETKPPRRNGAHQHKAKAPAAPARPVSILPRPGSSHRKEPERAEPNHDLPALTTREPERETANAPQPQILRRPPQAEQKLSEAMPQHLSFDRRGSQTAEHRQALLSLFNRPSPEATPPPARSEKPFSPMESFPGPPLTLNTRSRQPSGSDCAGPAARSQRTSSQLGSESQTPKTPVDKSFLLGFLEGHTRGDRR